MSWHNFHTQDILLPEPFIAVKSATLSTIFISSGILQLQLNAVKEKLDRYLKCGIYRGFSKTKYKNKGDKFSNSFFIISKENVS